MACGVGLHHLYRMPPQGKLPASACAAVWGTGITVERDDRAETMTPRELMTTKEVADYLRLKERKVYDLVRQRRIPCLRVTGKWLFPRALIELWVLQKAEGAQQVKSTVERPPVIAGSHDPLLEWSVRESECDLALMFNGSLDGLNRFAQGKGRCCGLHVFEPESGDYNRAVVARTLAGLDVVLIEWAWREQGLIMAAGNPHRIRDLSGIRQARLRLVDRQEGAGSRLLFHHLLGRFFHRRLRTGQHRPRPMQHQRNTTEPNAFPPPHRSLSVSPRDPSTPTTSW